MMSNLFNTGIRPKVDEYLAKKAAEERDYGNYWSASSGGYCMRKQVFQRLGVPPVKEEDARKTRVFESGHIFHEWLQRITKDSGISIAQEVELQDEDIMVRGHFDDLILVDGNLILYDYKTQNSRAFSYQKGKPMSYYHKMQLGTYMYMLRKNGSVDAWYSKQTSKWELDKSLSTPHPDTIASDLFTGDLCKDLEESRILKISKDDLRMSEDVLMWSEELKNEVTTYWDILNKYWEDKKIPPCTCADHEGGFLAKEAYNDYFYDGEPCSLEWYRLKKEEGALK